jgi:hypothetical protein
MRKPDYYDEFVSVFSVGVHLPDFNGLQQGGHCLKLVLKRDIYGLPALHSVYWLSLSNALQDCPCHHKRNAGARILVLFPYLLAYYSMGEALTKGCKPSWPMRYGSIMRST